MNPLLKVENLSVSFKTSFETVTPVSDVNLYVNKKEILGIVGESGCGKSVTAYSIIRLLSKNAVLGDNTKIIFDGEDLTQIDKNKLRDYRGNKISMIFQEPMTSLNPVFTIGWQLEEAYNMHQKLSSAEVHRNAVEMLKLVRISEPEKVLKDYPHLLSGGMRQRIMIAMALACKPSLLIADEPTTALDVTIQAQVLELMNELKNDFGTSIIMITHDLGVIAEMCDRVMVMYAGNVVEEATVMDLFDEPLHPYTQGLMDSIPKMDDKVMNKELKVIDGFVPHPSRFPRGCRFHPRCSKCMNICKEKMPPVYESKNNHKVSCWLYNSVQQNGGNI